MIETLGGIQSENDEYSVLVEETFLKPLKVPHRLWSARERVTVDKT